MYRGSSFLTRKDYRIHVPVVQELLDSRYDCLFGLECEDLRKPEIQQALAGLESFMERYYEGVRNSCKGPVNSRISVTLITKVLIGTLGCVPAYDRYFTEGIRSLKVTSGTYGLRHCFVWQIFTKRITRSLNKRENISKSMICTIHK